MLVNEPTLLLAAASPAPVVEFEFAIVSPSDAAVVGDGGPAPLIVLRPGIKGDAPGGAVPGVPARLVEPGGDVMESGVGRPDVLRGCRPAEGGGDELGK